MKKYLVLFLLQLVVITGVSAHGLGGSVEKTSGEYVLGIGYNTYVLESGKTISLDFDLFDLSRQPLEFDQVLVEIYKDDRILLSTFVPKPEFGYPVVDFFFAEAGTYNIDVKFINKDEGGFNKGIVEATFDFPIENSRPWYKTPLFMAIILVLVAGAASALIAYRVGRNSGK